MNEEIEAMLIEPNMILSLHEMVSKLGMPTQFILEMVQYGIIEPVEEVTPLSFSHQAYQRSQTLINLQRDLGLNLAGAALAVELLEEVQALRREVASLRNQRDSDGIYTKPDF